MATHLEYTPSSSPSGVQQTISFWVKRSELGTDQCILEARQNGTNLSNIKFNTDDRIHIYSENGGTTNVYVRPTRRFKDVNAWYHFVFSIDTSQGTAADRIKIYVNGVQETVMTTSTYPSSSYDNFWFGIAQKQVIGRDNGGSGSEDFQGILSHFHYARGNVYQASTFGSTDSTTGEWKINTSPTVTYGATGYFILKDGNSVTDQSPNTNNFTVGSGTLTKTEDCPSNVFCTINPLSNKIAFSLANGNTTLNDNGSDDNDNGLAGTMGVNSGKYYWEMKKGSGSGGVHAVITDDVDIRAGNRATSSPDSQLWGFQSNGTGSPLVSYIAGTFNSTGNALQGWGANDIVGFALDMDNGKLYVSINGVFKGLDNNTSDPANATNPAITGIPTGGKFILPYFEKRSGDSPETICNFGNGYFGTTAVSSNSGNGYSASGSLGIFQYQPPSGYTALCTKGLNE